MTPPTRFILILHLWYTQPKYFAMLMMLSHLYKIGMICTLHRLEYGLEIYYKASNTKINYNKVEAISLSGKNTKAYWRNALTDMKITKVTTVDDKVRASNLSWLSFNTIRTSTRNFYGATVRKPCLEHKLPRVHLDHIVSSIVEVLK